jgi:uncharacterized GH25 family protein
MKSVITVVILFFATSVFSQTIISGKIVDKKKGKPIAGANIYIDGTYDGATTNENQLVYDYSNWKPSSSFKVRVLKPLNNN